MATEKGGPLSLTGHITDLARETRAERVKGCDPTKRSREGHLSETREDLNKQQKISNMSSKKFQLTLAPERESPILSGDETDINENDIKLFGNDFVTKEHSLENSEFETPRKQVEVVDDKDEEAEEEEEGGLSDMACGFIESESILSPEVLGKVSPGSRKRSKGSLPDLMEEDENEAEEMYIVEKQRRTDGAVIDQIPQEDMSQPEKDHRKSTPTQIERKNKKKKSKEKVVRFTLPAEVRVVQAGVKETYYGYDDDSQSVDSEMSMSSRLSTSRLSLVSDFDDSVFDEVSRDELENNYQRLFREHLQLEKAFSTLQARTCSISPALHNANDYNWLEEQEVLNRTIRMLKNNMREQEKDTQRLRYMLHDVQEQNEILEFRVLELGEMGTKNAESERDVDEFELLEKNVQLEAEMTNLQSKLKELQSSEVVLKKENGELRDDIEAHINRYNDLQMELGTVRDELGILRTCLQEDEIELSPGNSPKPKHSQGNATAEISNDNAAEIDTSHIAARLEQSEQLSLQKEQDIQALKEELVNKEHMVSKLEKRVEELTERVSELDQYYNQDNLHGDQADQQDNEERDLEEKGDVAEKVTDLVRQLAEVKASEEAARNQIEALEEEKTKKIEALQERLSCIEENDLRLSETVIELEEVEHNLRQQIREYETRLKTADENKEYKAEITKLKNSKQNLVDKIEQMEANERLLKERLEEIESIKAISSSIVGETKSEGVSYAKQIEQIEACARTIDELSKKVERLTRREGELLENLYQMKLENQELKEHVDELVAEAVEKNDDDKTDSLSEGAGNLPDIITQLQSEICQLKEEKANLKDQILRTKSASIDNVSQTEAIIHCAKCTENQSKISELERFEDSQIDLRENVRNLKAEIENKNRREKYLLEKMDCLEQSEGKLLEIVNALEKNEESILAKLESQSRHTSAEHINIHRTEVQCQTESAMTQSGEKDENGVPELRHLREKVDLLMDSEEKLMSRLLEQEEVENGLNERITQYKTEIGQLQIANQELREKQETENSIDSTRLLKDRINQLEKAETNLKKKASALDKTVTELHEFNKQLQEKLLSQLDGEKLLKKRIGELESSEKSFINKVSELESHNGVLVKLVEQRDAIFDHPDEAFSSGDSQTGSASDQLPETPHKQSGFKQCPSTPDALARLESHSPDISNDAQDLICLDKDELVGKICELKQMEKYQQIRIMELTENLNNFREAVQVAAVTMETDNGHPLSNFKVKQQDVEFQACVQDLVKSELVLKLNVLELEKKEAILNSRLQKANVTLKEQETDYKEDIDRLEQEIDKLRRNEARLKSKLQYGGWGQESQALAKVDHLQGLVFDLEVSERKLKRRVQELEHIQRQLRDKLDEAESIQNAIDRKLPGNIRDLDGKHHGALVAPLGVLDFSTSTEKRSNPCGENSALSTKIADIEVSEKGLRRHLELLENQEPNLLDEIPAMLDSPNAILKQRISELEKIERHMKKQLVELEKDRDELHEITRKDKGLIHELSVQNRELELSEKSMKDQINRYEAQETQQLKHVQDITDKLEEMEDAVSKLEAKERRLKAKLHKQHATETDLTSRLDTAVEDAQNMENKLSRRISELEKERLTLQGKLHELTDRVGVLELSEISLKQKLRTAENSDASLKREVEDLEKTETDLTRQAAKFETQNEALYQNVHKLEDENASLLCEVSDLEKTINKLQKTNKSYEKKILDAEKELEELGCQDAELKEKVKQHVISEQELQKTVDELEQNAQRLRLRIRELERRVPMTDNEIILSSCLGQDHQLSSDQEDGILQHLETENFRLQEKIKLYEICQSDQQMATLPKSELEEMRSQLQLLPELEEAVAWREKSENHLKDTIAKLREGKEACGHEKEIEELREQASRTKFLLRANYLLKTNYGDVKEELQRVKDQSQSGSHIVRPPRTMDTAVQVNLRQMSREFKNAMKDLGANHPEAFADFIQHLPGDDLTPGYHGDQAVVPTHSVDEVQDDSNKEGRKTILIKSASVDAEPELVRYLVTAIPDNQSEYVTWAEEEPYWKAVEGKTYVAETKQKDTHSTNKDGGRSLHWTVQFTKDLDHLTDADDESQSMRSDASVPPPVPSSQPPPLPGSRPPPPSISRARSPDAESYYLPSWQNDGDSADEAPEIDDEVNEMDDVIPSPLPTRIRRTMRAKSAERDSDFSEGTYSLLGTSPQDRRGKHFRLAGSLDSIPDSGVYPDDDVRILKDRIRDLQSEIKIKENELELERKQHKQFNKVNDNLDLENQLKEKKTELQSEKKNLSDKNREIEHLKSDVNKLDRQLNTKTAALEDLTRTKEELQTKLQTQSRDVEIFALQHQDMQSKITVLESELRKKEDRETELTKMNASLKHQVDGMEKQNSQYRLMQEDYEAVRAKYDEMEQIKLKAQSTITPLRAKVIRLAHMCQNKDDLIARLASELRCYSESSDVINEADRERVKGSSEDYGRPISPLTIRNLEFFERELSSSEDGLQMKKPSRIPLRVSPLSLSSSGSPGSASPDGAQTEHYMFKPIASHSADASSADAPRDSHPHKDYTPDKPYRDSNLQPPQLSFSPVTHLNQLNRDASKDNSSHKQRDFTCPMHRCRVLRNYQPEFYTETGLRHLDRVLREGDIVKAMGPVDDGGNYEVYVNGKVGLVPANYLRPLLSPTPPRRHKHRRKQPLSSPVTSSPEQILQMHDQLQHSHVPSIHVPHTSTALPSETQTSPRTETHTSPRTSGAGTPPINHPAYVRTNNTLPPVSPKSPRYGSHPVLNPDKAKPPNTPTPAAGPPMPPSHFHIEKVVGKHSVVLGWITPDMDVMGQSNGVTVKGYQIYINKRERQVIASAHVTKALVEKLDLQKSHRFGIQTLSEDGQVSIMVQTVLEDFSPELGSERFSDRESTAGDSSSVVSLNLHDDVNRRVFMAVYDYSPSEHSPHHYPVEELSFKTGDIIATYGNVRDDGFYYSKVHGKKGLVPASFIEEVALVRSPSMRSTSSGSVMSHGNYAASTSSRISGRHHHDNRSHHKHATKMAIAQV